MFSRLMARARLRQLQLLVTVADQGSLKRAAAEVGMSQPAATQALAELEQLIEQPLFDRHAKGMRLTAAGCALMPVIRSVLEALQASTESLAALQEGVSGVLRVGVITALSLSVTGASVLRLCARHPEVRLEILEDAQPHLIQELMSGSLDLVLCRRVRPLPARLHFEWLCADEAVVVAGTGHALVGRQGLRLKDLGGYTWMRAARGVWIREVFDGLFAEAGLSPRLHPISTTSLGPLPDILRDNQTLSLAPASLSQSLCRWNQARILDVQIQTPHGEIGVLCAADALEEPMHAEIIVAMRESLMAACPGHDGLGCSCCGGFTSASQLRAPDENRVWCRPR
jgi:molybdate transport repressor ModE-like protein